MKTTRNSTVETETQKAERWAKNLRMAASFAKQANLDRKAKAERKRIKNERLIADGSRY